MGCFWVCVGSFLCSLHPACQPPSHPPRQPCQSLTQPAMHQASQHPGSQAPRHSTGKNITKNDTQIYTKIYTPRSPQRHPKFVYTCCDLCATVFKTQGLGSQITWGTKIEFKANYGDGLRGKKLILCMCQHPRLCTVLVVHLIYFNNEVEQNTFGPIIRYLSIPWLKPYLKPFVYLSSMSLIKPKLEPQEIKTKHIGNHRCNRQLCFPKITWIP